MREDSPRPCLDWRPKSSSAPWSLSSIAGHSKRDFDRLVRSSTRYAPLCGAFSPQRKQPIQFVYLNQPGSPQLCILHE